MNHVATAVCGAGVGLGVLLVLHRHTPLGQVIEFARHRAFRLLLATSAGAAATAATGWIVALPLTTTACLTLPALLSGDARHARHVARLEAVATWTEMLRDTLAAAAGLEQAIRATAALAPEAVRTELAQLTADLDSGVRLPEALRRLADNLDDPAADLVVAALLLACDQPAKKLTDLFGSLAHAAREQVAMRLRVEAGRARTRTSIRVITGTTLTFAVAVIAFNNDYVTPYRTGIGQLVLLLVGVLFGLGFTWLARIAATRPPARFLRRTPTGSPS